MRLSLLFFLAFCCLKTLAAVPENDDIKTATKLNSVINFCSAEAAYSNVDATESPYRKGSFWNSAGKDIWYKFTAIRTDVNITVTGKNTSASPNTLLSPLIAIYTFDGTVLSEMIGTMSSSNNITTAYKGGLAAGTEYYIRISAEQDRTGSFQLCINNYNPPAKPGQDCATASILCSKEAFTQLDVSGSGNNNSETAGTCIRVESNSAWYKWTADNNGTLTFTITPNSNTDDVDWVLYDLGVNGDCSKLLPENAIRCAAGNGINCSPKYYITGLNMSSTDISEASNCPPGQDGWLKYVDMVSGHNYALMVNNFSSGNNGFAISFGGTGEFKGPASEIQVIKNNVCTAQQSFTFFTGTGSNSVLEWNFGTDASLSSAASTGPHQITYGTTGSKSISLKATNDVGCTVSTYYNLYVATKPALPAITASKTKLCVDDVLILSTDPVPDAVYSWTGPNGFSSNLQNPKINITGPENSGNYQLIVQLGDCQSDPSIISIPEISGTVTAEFDTDPVLEGKYGAPISISFTNRSANAESYAWDFGDGYHSTEKDPVHVYQTPGSYMVSLTSVNKNECLADISKGKIVVLKDATVVIPGSFSPNGDGINDEFQIGIANLKTYHISIINRWGVKVFETFNIMSNWNGKHRDQDLPTGVYYYLINGKDFKNTAIRLSGSITLIR